MSEVGPDGIEKFASAKHFTSWLRLAPNNKISGGKLLSHRLKTALHRAANSIGNLKGTHLSDFFRKIAYRKGRMAAVSATARKLAVIIWNMMTKKEPYKPPVEYIFRDEKRKMVRQMKRRIRKMGIAPEDLGVSSADLAET